MNHSRLRMLTALVVGCLTLLIWIPVAFAEDVDPSATIRQQARRIEMLFQMGNEQRANQELVQMLVMHKQHPTMLAVLGHFKRLSRDTNEAVKLLNQAMAIDPNHAYANIEMANIELGQRQTSDCFKRVGEMVKQHPNDPDVIGMQATLLTAIKKPQAAEKLLLAFVGRNDSIKLKAAGLAKLAEVYESQDKKQQACQAIFAALKAVPDDPAYGSQAMEIMGRAGARTMALEAARLMLANVENYNMPDETTAKMKQMVQAQISQLSPKTQLKTQPANQVDLTALADDYAAAATDAAKRKTLADAVITFVANHATFKRTDLIADQTFDRHVYWEQQPTFEPAIQKAFDQLPKAWQMEDELEHLVLTSQWDKVVQTITPWEAIYPSPKANTYRAHMLLRQGKTDEAQQAAAIGLVMAAYEFAHEKANRSKFLEPRGGTYFEALGMVKHIADLKAGKQPPMQKLVDQFYDGIKAEDAIAAADAYTQMDRYRRTNGYGWFMNDLVYDSSIQKWIQQQLFGFAIKSLENGDAKSFDQFAKLMDKGRYVTYHIHTLDLLVKQQQDELKPDDRLFEQVFRQWGYEPHARLLKGKLLEKQGQLDMALLEYNAGTAGRTTDRIKPQQADELACAKERDRLEKQMTGTAFDIYSKPINSILKLGRASTYPDNAALLAAACSYLMQDIKHMSNGSLMRIQMNAMQNVEPKASFNWQAIMVADTYIRTFKDHAASGYRAQGNAYHTLKKYEKSGDAYMQYAALLTDNKAKAKGYYFAMRSYRAGYLRDKAADAGAKCIATGGADLDTHALYMWVLKDNAQFKLAAQQAKIVAEGYRKLNNANRAKYYEDKQQEYAQMAQWATTQPAMR
ncbi:MAG: tetratricopeptide repeat protein [Phycisphaeraceae bacterium JB051]